VSKSSKAPPTSVEGNTFAAAPEQTYPFGIWCSTEPEPTSTTSIVDFYNCHSKIKQEDSDSIYSFDDYNDPFFLFHDETFEESLSPPVGPSYDPSVCDMSYDSLPEFLDWRYPKTIADCAVYNTLYADFPPVSMEGVTVPGLWEHTNIPPLSVDPSPDMDALFEEAELSHPEEYTGKRELQFYKDWHAWIESDSDSETDFVMEIDDSKHPKDLPRCN